NMPRMDGFGVLSRLRQKPESQRASVLMLSARSQEHDIIRAFELGADDYVTKPFGPDELLARVRACLRRSQNSLAEDTGTLVRSDLTIDFDRHRVLLGEEEIRLTPKEFELLAFLARNPGKVLTHRTILKAIWGPHAVSEPQYLRVLMASLRKKIEPDPSHPKYVLTEPWVGYRFREV
ncbi:MAG TPA: response regulator transcription factor, partial [Vicinamibacteria bacterium]